MSKALQQLAEAVEGGAVLSSMAGLKQFDQLTAKALPQGDLAVRRAAWRAYGGSLDAAKALHDALLPEWSIEICDFWVRLRFSGKTAFANAEKETMARSWLLAILRAKLTEADHGQA